jgi:hypothetical protein
LDTSVIATCKHNAEIQDSMLVAWKNFKDLNPLKIVAIISTTCSDNTNTWRLFTGLIWISESRVIISVSSFQ